MQCGQSKPYLPLRADITGINGVGDFAVALGRSGIAFDRARFCHLTEMTLALREIRARRDTHAV